MGHVKAVVDKNKRVPYLNRHNETNQNVLVVCDFDMRFTFVLSGWPSSAHDMRVFKDAMSTYLLGVWNPWHRSARGYLAVCR
jgi:hypothetical protein